jgi:hypothetical protein
MRIEVDDSTTPQGWDALKEIAGAYSTQHNAARRAWVVMAILCVSSLVVLIAPSKTEVDLPFGLGQMVSAQGFALVVSLLIVATYIGYASCHVQAVRVREAAERIIGELSKKEPEARPSAREWFDFMHSPGTMRVSPLAADLGRGTKVAFWVLKVLAFAAHDALAVVVVALLAARLYGDLTFWAFAPLGIAYGVFGLCFLRCAIEQFSAAKKGRNGCR